MAPDIPLDLLDSYIRGRYQAIQDVHPWTLNSREHSISFDAQYDIGSVIATKGLADITLNAESGGVWTSAMDGRWIVIGGRGYMFSHVGPTAGRLDRPYEGEDAATAPYRINVWRVPAPPEFLWVDRIDLSASGARSADADWGTLRAADPMRLQTGTPCAASWVGTWIEIYPLPVTVSGAIVNYKVDIPTPSRTTDPVDSPIAREAALRDGVMSDIRLFQGRVGESSAYEGSFQRYVALARARNDRAKGTVTLGIDLGGIFQ